MFLPHNVRGISLHEIIPTYPMPRPKVQDKSRYVPQVSTRLKKVWTCEDLDDDDEEWGVEGW